jgi:hypothetical protein
MIFSVYRPELRSYDYYERPATLDDARNPASDDVGKRYTRSGTDGQDLGVSSERAGYRLPADARRIGQGDAPRGQVVTRNPGAPAAVDGLGGVLDVVTSAAASVPWWGWLAAGIVGYKVLKRK